MYLKNTNYSIKCVPKKNSNYSIKVTTFIELQNTKKIDEINELVHIFKLSTNIFMLNSTLHTKLHEIDLEIKFASSRNCPEIDPKNLFVSGKSGQIEFVVFF